MYINTEEEKNLKTTVWEEINREYLEVLRFFPCPSGIKVFDRQSCVERDNSFVFELKASRHSGVYPKEVGHHNFNYNTKTSM